MIPSLLELAVRNSAAWCDAVCRAHGIPGEFHQHLWLNQNSVPRFYPNAVTLTTTVGAAEELSFIRSLPAAQRLRIPAVKVSCSPLDLAPLSFAALFEATWLVR